MTKRDAAKCGERHAFNASSTESVGDNPGRVAPAPFSIGELVWWECDGLILAGNIVSADAEKVAVCNVEQVKTHGNVAYARPIIFVSVGMVNRPA